MPWVVPVCGYKCCCPGGGVSTGTKALNRPIFPERAERGRANPGLCCTLELTGANAWRKCDENCTTPGVRRIDQQRWSLLWRRSLGQSSAACFTAPASRRRHSAAGSSPTNNRGQSLAPEECSTVRAASSSDRVVGGLIKAQASIDHGVHTSAWYTAGHAAVPRLGYCGEGAAARAPWSTASHPSHFGSTLISA